MQHFFANFSLMEKYWQNLLRWRGVLRRRMYKILIGLIVAAVIALLAIRMMPRSKLPVDEVASPTQEKTSAPQASARQAEADDSRFREWIMGNTGTGSQGEAGLREFAWRADPSGFSYSELERLLDALAEDAAEGLALMDRILEEPSSRWKPMERERLLRRAGALAAEADFEGLAGRLEVLGTLAERSFFAQGAAEALAKRGVGESLAWAETLESELQASAFYGAGRAWAQTNAEEAIEWAEGLEEPEIRQQALSGLAAGWALTAPEEAYEYAANAPKDLRGGLIVELAGAVALSNPKQASQWAVEGGLLSSVGDERQKSILEEGVFGWASQDFEGVFAWSERIARSDLRDAAMTSWVDYWAQEKPQEAAKWAAKFPTKRARADMLERALARWSQANPQDVAGWFERRPVELDELVLWKQTLRRTAESDWTASQDLVDAIAEPTFKRIGEELMQSLPVLE